MEGTFLSVPSRLVSRSSNEVLLKRNAQMSNDQGLITQLVQKIVVAIAYQEIGTMPSFDIFVDQYINYLILEKGLSKNTIESYSRDISRYVEYPKQKKDKQISNADTPRIITYLISLS